MTAFTCSTQLLSYIATHYVAKDCTGSLSTQVVGAKNSSSLSTKHDFVQESVNTTDLLRIPFKLKACTPTTGCFRYHACVFISGLNLLVVGDMPTYYWGKMNSSDPLLLQPCSSFYAVPCCPHEPRRHPAPQRAAGRGRGQLPTSAAAQARRRHHPVQSAQALEHHAEAGAAGPERAGHADR